MSINNLTKDVNATQAGAWNVAATVAALPDMAETGSAAPGEGYLVYGVDAVSGEAVPIAVDEDGIVQTSGSGGGGGQIEGTTAHDAAFSDNPVVIGGFAKATAPTNVSADGDAVNAWFDLAGRQAIFDGGGSITVDCTTGWAPVLTDGSAAGTTGYHVLGTDGTNAQIISTNSSGHINIADGGNSITVDGSVSITGSVTITDGSGSLTVDGGVTVAGSVAHDAAYSGSPVLIGGYASASAPSDVSADGDVVRLWLDRAGRTIIGDGGGSITVDGTVAVSAVSGNVSVVGPAAHDAAVSGNPVRISGYASNSAPSDVADGDTCNIWVDRAGRQIIADGGGSISVDDNGSTLSIDDGGSSITIDGTGIGIVGAAAHDAAASGNPILLGAYASATPPSVVSADGDAVRLWASLDGRLHTYTTGETVSTLNTQAAISVTTSRTALLSSNASRKGFIIVNRGDFGIYVGNGSVVDGTSAGANGGVYVSANGGSFSGSQMYGYTGAIQAVGEGTTVVGVLEW